MKSFLFIFGITLIIIGYAKQVSGDRDTNREIEFVPRSIYDQLVHSNIIK